MSPSLKVLDVYKSFGAKRVLDNVDLKVADGELCALVGPSGCGKSTLLRLILGQIRADSGLITLDGADLSAPDPRRGIVYQRYSLYPHLSVIDNITLGLRLPISPWQAWLKRREFHDQAMAVLERMRLAEHARKYPHELSGGMQQRVAIAQALIKKPRILMMDEPFGALDPDTREQMQLFLLELWEQQKMTVFFVTHDLVEAAYLGTRVVVLSQYYVDDRGDGADVPRGAKVVADYALPRQALATDVKQLPEFTELVEDIRRQGFDPNYRKHVAEFNLSHPHSFQTLTAAERGA